MSEFIEVHRDIWKPVFAVLDNSPATTRGVLITMAMLGGTIRCTAKELAGKMGLQPRRLAQILRKLERAGHIRIDGGGAVRTITITSEFIRADGEWDSGSVEYADSPFLKGAALWRGGGILASTRKRILARDGEVCRWCGATEGPWHIDHVKAVAKGGKDNDANLCVSCAPCNLSKGAKSVCEWKADA